MRTLLILFFILINSEAWGICSAPITRRNVNTGEINYSAVINTDFNTLYSHINEVDGDCFVENSIPTSALADDVIGEDEFANATITAAKFAPGVFPTYQKLIRARAYVSSATWVRGLDVSAVFVQVVGGGGASTNSSGTAGGVSRFGLHCAANGGASTTGLSAGVGGTATGGDINLPGGDGYRTTVITGGCSDPICPGCVATDCRHTGDGGKSILSPYGNGGVSVPGGGGGAGGYCAKLILKASLNSSETVTVGTAAVSTFTSPSGDRRTGVAPAGKGIVIIYEFGD
jgi:hypothetical protein